MVAHPLTPANTVEHHTVSHYTERRNDPTETPQPARMMWREIHDTTLGTRFAAALKKLEGLMYAVCGGQPDYLSSPKKQWDDVDLPRCRWFAEQRVESQGAYDGPISYGYLESAALGEFNGDGAPATGSVPIRSHSMEPLAVRAGQAAHQLVGGVEYFPAGSVTITQAPHAAHDFASSDELYGWTEAQDVEIVWTRPAGVTLPTTIDLKYQLNGGATQTVTMTTADSGVTYTATLSAEAQDTTCNWWIEATWDAVTVHEPAAAAGTGAPTAHYPLAGTPHCGDAYAFCWYTHYNPYAYGLPELMENTKRGTDEYRFDATEEIQPGLINLVRYILQEIVKGGGEVPLFEHAPSVRSADDCCVTQHIHWRWAGSNLPDLYVSGGKGTAIGGDTVLYPLHNLSGDTGSAAARSSWRGIGSHWRGAYDLFTENVWLDDSESWLPREGMLALEPDPLSPPDNALMRTYSQRGLRENDIIEAMHIEELIAAINYVVDHGLWYPRPVNTAKRTPGTMFGLECGWAGYSGFEEVLTNDSAQCTHDGGTDYPKPSWAQCTGGCSAPDCYSGMCIGYKWRKRECWYNPASLIDQWADDYIENFCGYGNFPGYPNVLGGIFAYLWYLCPLYDEFWEVWRWSGVNEWYRMGASYWLCSPLQNPGGPDSLHGNDLTKLRKKPSDVGGYYDTGPSMGNRFGAIEKCHASAPGQPASVGWGEVVGVKLEGVGGPWDGNQACSLVDNPDAYTYFPDIVGLGQYSYDRTARLATLTHLDSPCSASEKEMLTGQVDISSYPVCMGDYVYVSLDLNLDGEGVPTLYDYDLEIDPDDFPGVAECPCQTHGNTGVCA